MGFHSFYIYAVYERIYCTSKPILFMIIKTEGHTWVTNNKLLGLRCNICWVTRTNNKPLTV